MGTVFLERRLPRAERLTEQADQHEESQRQRGQRRRTALCSHASKLAKDASFLPASAEGGAVKRQSTSGVGSQQLDGGGGVLQRTRLAACDPR